MLHISVTQSYNHVSHGKIIENSRRNNIIQHIIYILILKQTHSYLE